MNVWDFCMQWNVYHRKLKKQKNSYYQVPRYKTCIPVIIYTMHVSYVLAEFRLSDFNIVSDQVYFVRQVDNVLNELRIDNEGYVNVMDIMTRAFNKGLSRKYNAEAAVKMFPSYVRSVPDGTGKLELRQCTGISDAWFLCKVFLSNITMKSQMLFLFCYFFVIA